MRRSPVAPLLVSHSERRAPESERLMPVATIELPSGLREVVDRFILADPQREHGGFLFGTPLRFDTFLPVPNVAEDRRNTYKVAPGWNDYTVEFERITGSGLIAHVHTHPSHSIPSEQDFKAGKYWFRHVRYMVLIAPNAEGNRTTWWVLDERAEVQDLVCVTAELEAATLLVARRFGLANLGEVMMDPEGRLLAQGALPQALMDSPDARQLYTRLLAHGRSVDTKTELAKVAGLSAVRTNAAAALLARGGLLSEKEMGWGRYTPVDIFGRRLK
jgi:proteasome lid subunit RPN8/RPN11